MRMIGGTGGINHWPSAEQHNSTDARWVVDGEAKREEPADGMTHYVGDRNRQRIEQVVLEFGDCFSKRVGRITDG